MKAPEQINHTPEVGVQSINYSMLPPDKLPDWLLKKNTPVKVYNYSMHPPGTQPQVVEYVQERELESQEALIQPLAIPLVVEPPVIETRLPAPENISEIAVPDVVVPAPEVETDAPEKTDKVSSIEERNPQYEQEELVTIASAPTPNADAPPAPAVDDNTPVIQPDPQVAPPTPVEPPKLSQFGGQQEYSSNAPRSVSKSFVEWIHNSSNTSMIIVVGIGIIVFSIVLMILLALGVV